MNYNPSNHGHYLLEEWPDYNQHPQLKKRVRFAKYSEVRFYQSAERPADKCYSKADIKKFRAHAFLLVSKLEKLILKTNMPTGIAIHSMIDFGVIKHDDLIGLEHIVTQQARQEFAEVRKNHVAVVLRGQYLIRVKFADSSDEVAASMLSKVSIISSSKSVKKAMLRARMIMMAVKQDFEEITME